MDCATSVLLGAMLAAGALRPAAAGLRVPEAGNADRQVDVEEVPVFIFAGQSNMVGFAQPGELPAQVSAAQRDVLFYYPDDAWRTFAPREVPLQGSAGLGPEVTAGRILARRLGTVGMVKYAVGGTNLCVDWNPLYAGSLYEKMAGRTEQALADLYHKENKRGRIAGFFWMQGESDAATAMPAVMYMAHLMTFISYVRQEAGDPELPFIIGRISPSLLWRYGATVRLAQQIAAAKVRNVAIVSTDDLPLRADGAHYDTAALAALGDRFAAAYLKLRPAAQPATGSGR
ncbi:MAG: hypothetical protein NTX64_02835 [Elusimicrobia bacterium]|nr:hypothetical protein [Elusimicrobiota bacterium]